MRKERLILGIICLVLAAGLAAVSWQLPPEKLMFMLGRVNVPMVILAVAGLALLLTARQRA